MSSPPTMSSNNHLKKPIRELSSITNHLLLTKTLNAFTNNTNNNTSPALNNSPTSSTASFKENIPNETNSIAQQKALNLRLAAALKPGDRDNVATLLQFYQTLAQTNASTNAPIQPTSTELPTFNSSSNAPVNRSKSSKATTSKYLCRFNQRNRLIEVPMTSEFYNQSNTISHEQLKQLIIQEFQLQKASLIIQIWNEQYQEYIDIESFKKLPSEGRLQVMIEKPLFHDGNSFSVCSKSPTTSNPISMGTHINTLHPTQSLNSDHHYPHSNDEDLSSKSLSEDVGSTSLPLENVASGPMYDLLPKPSDGIPIPRFPPHIAAFLNGNGDANQLNALVQALYQEIVKYELYPNADELRSIVSRLVDRHPHSLAVIGSVELLVRKLYYKFCNERKKYPVELKRRQPNKRKRLTGEEELTQQQLKSDQTGQDLEPFLHLWNTA